MNPTVKEIADFLESIAPLHLQESYDNSGLLIGTGDEIATGAVICLDCTDEVIDEAIRLGSNLIISHHPPIFYGIKKLNDRNATERIVRKAIEHDIVLYAIHTNLDNVLENGVNQKIAETLGLEIKGVLRSGNNGEGTGSGILARFSDPKQEVEFLQLLQEKMNAKVVRHSALTGKPIRDIAICGGSGSFLLEDARQNNVQAFVTADWKYHGFFEAEGDLLICDIGHYESEQFTIQLLFELISGKFPNFAAHCTGVHTNPVHYFT